MSTMVITTKITHKYLTGKTKDQLAWEYLQLLDRKCELEAEVERLQAEKENALVEIYARGNQTAFAAVAQVCDEKLDRSGALLGRVRERYHDRKAGAP